MDKRFLVKGKRLDGKGWEVGYLVKTSSAVQIGDCSPWYICVPPVDPDDSGGYYNVDFSTVEYIFDSEHMTRGCHCCECDLWNDWDKVGKREYDNLVCSCAHWSREGGPIVYTRPNDFCSYGERRTSQDGK